MLKCQEIFQKNINYLPVFLYRIIIMAELRLCTFICSKTIAIILQTMYNIHVVEKFLLYFGGKPYVYGY